MTDPAARRWTFRRTVREEVFLDFDPVLDGLCGPPEGVGPDDEGRCAMTGPDVILLKRSDLLRLADLLSAAARTWPCLQVLERKLGAAVVVPDVELPPDVVALGSRFAFTDLRTGGTETYWLVSPAAADLDRGRLSVFAPICTAVLGMRAGQVASWDVPWGRRAVRIEHVLNPPRGADLLPGSAGADGRDADDDEAGAEAEAEAKARAGAGHGGHDR